MDERLTTIKGIGPGREKQLHKLGITTVTSLLTYFPRSYEDRRTIYRIGELKSGMTGGVVGNVIAVQEKRPRPRLSILEVVIADGTGPLKIVLFNQGYKKNFYKKGQRLYAYGKAEFQYGSMQMNTPQIENLGDGGEPDRGIVPIYALADGVSQFVVRSSVRNWFAANHELQEILPAEVREAHQYMSRYDAFKMMHFPESSERYEDARHQLAYEELFVMQSGLALLRNKEQCHKGPKMGPNGDLMAQCIEHLPFSLTGDQQRALEDIRIDMEDERPMQRLLQGDVGSGKTVVATLSLLKAIENGYQGALMAPTEILAAQHYEGITEVCGNLGITIELLTGSTTKKEKERIYEGLADGSINMIIGTHALIQEGVNFHNLGLVIIDEQHRFGVHQRLALWEKGQQQGFHPHQLIMTATPIPRTLAMTAYADLDTSVIDELPPGRTPVTTVAIPDTRRTDIIDRVRHACITEGRQAYWVCTLIEESELLEAQAAEATWEELKLALPELNVGLVHGRMKPAEKQAVMASFKQGELHLLVATTVIEVGVDVPNASLMIIENPERLGLAQLHQLRGRVGRGAVASHCVLLYKTPLSKTAQIRLQVLRDSNDGFVIAQKDLEIRGPGELLGTRQTGNAEFKVADLLRDQAMIPEVQRLARHIHERYPQQAKALIERWMPETERYSNA